MVLLHGKIEGKAVPVFNAMKTCWTVEV